VCVFSGVTRHNTFHSEDEGRIFPKNIGKCQRDYMYALINSFIYDICKEVVSCTTYTITVREIITFLRII
jgi:hypothetical protein